MFAALTSRFSLRYAPSILGSVSKRVLTPLNATAARSFYLSQPRLDPAAKSRTTKPKVAEKAKTSKTKAVAASKTARKKKPVVKKTATKKVAAAAKKPVARLATKKVAKKAAKPKAIKLLPEQKPPRVPGGPFILFFRKYLQGADLSHAEDKRTEMKKIVSEAARVWRSLSDHEKQAFKDEFKTNFEEYAKKREEYYKNVDPAILRQFNRLRVQRGKSKVHAPASLKTRQPATPYVLFFTAERIRNPRSLNGPEEQRTWTKELAAQWNAMSDAEKQPYRDQYVEARKAYVASRA